MKRFTLFVMSLFVAVVAMAQFDTSKQYRIKSVSRSNYLTIGTSNANTHGHVYGAAKNANSQDQVFTFVDAGAGKYYLKSASGKYFSGLGTGAGWNVNYTTSVSNALAMTFESAGNDTYYISCNNGYFKYEYVDASGNYHPFNDATKAKAEKWAVEDKDAATSEGGNGDNDVVVDTEDKSIYDFSGFDIQKMLDLFYAVNQQGRNYPTIDEFKSIGIQESDIAFVRSHVRRAEILSRADRLLPETYETRNLFMNIPMDVGSGGAAGYPNDKFSADVFSMWQYTNLFGSWNHGFFQAPGAWVDAAHRNGTDIMSGIAFFESWTGDGDAGYSAMITQKVNGEFKYVKPLINCLMYFGADGINYNWEDNSYSNADIVAFHKALYKRAAEVGFTNYHSAIYTAIQGLTSYNTSQTNALFGNSEGKTHDLMLNYMSGDFTGGTNMSMSVQAAEGSMGTADGLYTGVWIAGMDRSWNNLEFNSNAHKIGICLWGEHGQSRFFSYNVGDGAFDTQGNYQRILERGFSGGNRNPINRPAVTKANSGKINWEPTAAYPYPLMNFAGLATWIPERSAIQGNFHFLTHFTLGNGDRYFYKGKKSYAGGWYNMSSQDLVPTYRWLRYKSNTTNISTDIEVNYTHLDAYTGGSSIELTGASTSTGTDIVLYKTSLKVSGSEPYANIAVKSLKGAKASDLYLILKKQGSNTWMEYAYGNIAGNTWEEKKINLSGLSTGDVVERVGFRVKGNNNDYQLYIGKLELNDNSTVTPARIKENSLVAEVKKETKTSMTVKLHWGVDAVAKTRADWGLVYNDEANIDHFEVLMKVGEKKVMKVGTTSQWATLVPNIDFESINDEVWIGVRSISTDLKTYSPTEWVEVPRAPQSQLPEKEEEYGNYGISQMDEQCEGADIAREQRYVTSVTTTGATQNLNYSANGPVADGTQYAKALDHVLKVAQGQTINMTIKCADFSDGLKWCFAGGWMDLNGSGDFDKPLPVERTAAEIADGKTTTDPEGERLFFAGTIRAATESFQTTGLNFSFKIPDNATPGQSRLRIVFSDAWFAGMFNPVGYHAKGFTIDFSVEITGNNPGRVVVDTRDQGEAESPEDIFDTTSVEEVVSGEISTAEAVDGGINIENADVAWIYTADGKLVEYVKNPAQVAVETGVYLVKMQNGNIIRSAKVLVK